MTQINPAAAFDARKLKYRFAAFVMAAATKPVFGLAGLFTALISWLADVGEGTRSHLLKGVIAALILPSRQAVVLLLCCGQILAELHGVCVQRCIRLLELESHRLGRDELGLNVDQGAGHLGECLGIQGGLEDVRKCLRAADGRHEFRDHR